MLEVLINDGALSEVDVSRTLAAQAHMDWIDISTMIIPPQVINEIRGEDARRFKVIPVAFGESGLVVAVGNPLDIDTIDSLGFLLQRELELVCTSPKKIREALIKYYGTADEAADVLQKQIGEEIDLGLEIGDGTEAAQSMKQTHRLCGSCRCYCSRRIVLVPAIFISNRWTKNFASGFGSMA